MSLNRTDTGCGERIVAEITRQIADEEGVSPAELPPLYRAIGPHLLGGLPEPATLTFPYHGYTVTVRGDETVTTREASEDQFGSDD